MITESKFHVSKEQLSKEQDYIEAAKKDPAKFETLYKTYYRVMLQFVYQRVDSKDEAYDITSQVFLNALLNHKKYEFRGVPFSSWLYRIAINELNQLFRKNKAQKAINIDIEVAVDIIEEIEEENIEENHNALLKALSDLSEEDFQLIEMRFFEKRSFKEIGEIVEITENNAKVRTYRVLDKLKNLLKS